MPAPPCQARRTSWQRREQSLQRYVRAHLALKKLHQYAERAQKLAQDADPGDARRPCRARDDRAEERLDAHFDTELDSLLRDNDKDSAAELEALAQEYRDMGMSAFRVYHALIVRQRATAGSPTTGSCSTPSSRRTRARGCFASRLAAASAVVPQWDPRCLRR